MLVQTFADKYETTTANIYGKKKRGIIPDSVFYRENNSSFHIKEEFFIKRFKFKEQAITFNRETYWELSEKYNDRAIAVKIHNYCKGVLPLNSVYIYIRGSMFVDSPSSLNFRLKLVDWYFYRWARMEKRK